MWYKLISVWLGVIVLLYNIGRLKLVWVEGWEVRVFFKLDCSFERVGWDGFI